MQLVRLSHSYRSVAAKDTANAIVGLCCRHFGVTTRQIVSNDRVPINVSAKTACIFLIRRHTHMTYNEIGVFLRGHKAAHSTVVSACKRAKSALEKESDLGLAIAELDKKVISAKEKLVKKVGGSRGHAFGAVDDNRRLSESELAVENSLLRCQNETLRSELMRLWVILDDSEIVRK